MIQLTAHESEALLLELKNGINGWSCLWLKDRLPWNTPNFKREAIANTYCQLMEDGTEEYASLYEPRIEDNVVTRDWWRTVPLSLIDRSSAEGQELVEATRVKCIAALATNDSGRIPDIVLQAMVAAHHNKLIHTSV